MPAEYRSLISAECNRVVGAYSLVGQSYATAFLSFGPLKGVDEIEPLDQPALLKPRISLTKSQTGSGIITALNVELPSAHVVISKKLLDGLQYLVDDASQLFECFTQRTTKAERETTESSNISLIGSHFFSKSRSHSGSASLNSTSSGNSETVFRFAVSEGILH
jgi:autophagy-related protein 2